MRLDIEAYPLRGTSASGPSSRWGKALPSQMETEVGVIGYRVGGVLGIRDAPP